MFDFKVSTHTYYEDACRKFALTHNMEDVAKSPKCVHKHCVIS